MQAAPEERVALMAEVEKEAGRAGSALMERVVVTSAEEASMEREAANTVEAFAD